jgi:hypothetical protein
MADPCTPIPPGCFLIPRFVHLSQVLPGAGAFTAQAIYTFPPGTRGLTFWITYTSAGAPTGGPAFRLEGTNGTETARQLIQDDSSLAVAQPNAEVNVEMETVLGPIPANATPVVYKLPYNVDPGETGVRLLAAEDGNTGAPGTILIAITGEGGC